MKSEIRKIGDRLILSGTYYARMKAELKILADNRCERCNKFTLCGDVEHIQTRGLGGSKRDDRIFVDGKRNLLYLCRQCHTGRHIPDKVIPAKVTDSELMELLGVERKQQ